MRLIRRNRSLLVNLLSLVLLFAQFGMAAHASVHLGNDPDSKSTQVCDYCLSSTALQNMGGGDASFELAITVTPDHAIEAHPVVSIAAAAFTAFRSRAPPQIL